MEKITFKQANQFMELLAKAAQKKYLAVYQHSFPDTKVYDATTTYLLTILFNRIVDSGGQFTHVSTIELANLTRSTRKIVRNRLILLARYGFIKTISTWKNDGSNKRNPNRIYINPILLHCIGKGSRIIEKRAVVASLVDLGIDRLELEEDIQGFEVDTLYGQEEPKVTDNTVRQSAQDKLNEIVAKSNQAEAKKSQQKLERKQLDDAFVKSSANIWQAAQCKLGYGKSQPNWAGDNRSTTSKRERNELIAVFKNYGGATSALAWYVYCMGQAQFDAKGKLVFDHDAPHTQWVSSDKKPSQFGKNFNAVLSHETFKNRATEGWETIKQKLLEYYPQEILEAFPLDGDLPSAKLGYEIGSNGIEIEELS